MGKGWVTPVDDPVSWRGRGSGGWPPGCVPGTVLDSVCGAGGSSGGAGGDHAVADAQEQLAAFGLDTPGGLEVRLRGGDRVEQREVDPGLEEPVGAGERAEPGVGRHDVCGEMLAPDLAVGIAVLGGEQAGAVEIEERRQGGLGEGRPDGRADLGREALRDVVVAEPAADHVGVLAFSEGIVVGVPRPGLREALDAQLVEQRGDAVVDVLAAGASLRDALSA